MSDARDVVVFGGGVVIHAATLREFLKKSHYYMSYDPKTYTMKLSGNHFAGGQVLLEAQMASLESAAKFAQDIGLEADEGSACSWGKWNPVFQLDHDGSDAAEQLRLEMLRLGIPCRVFKTKSSPWVFYDGYGRYFPPSWMVDAVIPIIQKAAERYQAQLSSMP